MPNCSKPQWPSDSMNDPLLSWHSAVQHTLEYHLALSRMQHDDPIVVAASAAGEATPGMKRQAAKRKRTGGQVLLSESEEEPKSPAAASDSESDFSMGKCRAVGMRSTTHKLLSAEFSAFCPSAGSILLISLQMCQPEVSALPACASFQNDFKVNGSLSSPSQRDILKLARLDCQISGTVQRFTYSATIIKEVHLQQSHRMTNSLTLSGWCLEFSSIESSLVMQNQVRMTMLPWRMKALTQQKKLMRARMIQTCLMPNGASLRWVLAAMEACFAMPSAFSVMLQS